MSKSKAAAEYEPVPKHQADFCERRVDVLLEVRELRRPLPELLANAYWLGLQDAVEFMEARKALGDDHG